MCRSTKCTVWFLRVVGFILSLVLTGTMLLATARTLLAQPEGGAAPRPGTVWAWGTNEHGVLGDGTTINRYTPVQVQNLDNVIAISAGLYHSLALKSDGTVWAWGGNWTGQIGDGTTIDSYIPVQVPGLNNVISISADYNSMALKSDGSVWLWGQDYFGVRYRPEQVLSGVAAIATGPTYRMVLKKDGTVWVWGYNYAAGMGEISGPVPQRSPVIVQGLDHPTNITTGYGSFFALKEGAVWAWGSNGVGRLGNGWQGVGVRYAAPVQFWPNPTIEVAAGDEFTLGLAGDGTVWAAGANLYGRLGNGTEEYGPSLTPTQVQNLSNATAVAAGQHSMALRSDGTVWAWGANFFGNLGDGTTGNHSTPVQVSGLSGVAAISAGDWFSLALISSQSPNQPPTANVGGPYTVAEGSTVTLAGAGSDPENDPLVFEWDLNGDGAFESPGQSVLFSAVGYDGPNSRPVALRVCDDQGACSTSATYVMIENVAPLVNEITTNLDPLPIGSIIYTSAAFNDPSMLDDHTAVWDWGDGSSSAGDVQEVNGSGAANGNHMYAAAGIYTIQVTVIDDDGGSGQSVHRYVVIFDPAGGFVTGGGWFNSPAGSCLLPGCAATIDGKASFGFVSKYQKGATVPTGETQFQFKAGDLSFRSKSYQWLVVAGSKAKFMGDGTINDNGTYGFMLTGIDGAKQGAPDRFRIKIWDKSKGDVVVYDNQLGAADDGDAATNLEGGSIVIHGGK